MQCNYSIPCHKPENELAPLCESQTLILACVQTPHNTIVNRAAFGIIPDLPKPPPPQPHPLLNPPASLKGFREWSPRDKSGFSTKAAVPGILPTQEAHACLSRIHMQKDLFFSFKIMKDCLSVSITGSQHQ